MMTVKSPIGTVFHFTRYNPDMMTTPEQTFSDWLVQQLAQRNWDNVDLARQLGVVPSAVSQWVTGAQFPGPTNMEKLAILLGEDADRIAYLVFQSRAAKARGEHQPRRSDEDEMSEFVEVPVLGGVAAGGGVWYDRPYRLPRALVGRSKGMALFRVRGDSMEPEIRSGEMVLVDREAEPRSGNVVVASTPDGLIVKRLELDDAGMRLRGNDGSTVKMEDGVYVQGVVFSVRML